MGVVGGEVTELHDLKHWQMDIDVYPYDAGNLILPIPFREIQTNELLVQNSC